MDPLLREVLKMGERFLPPVFQQFFGNARYFGNDKDGDGPNPVRDAALAEVRRKDGSVTLWIGTRETGKSQGCFRQAESFGRPVYGVSPEEKMPSWIKQVDFSELDNLPHKITVILQDLPAYMSNRDYNIDSVQEIERIIPMCRHQRKWHLLFNTQSSRQADLFILDCDLAFCKPWGVLSADLERPNIAKIYKKLVMPYFERRSEWFIRTHAFMISRTYVGGIQIVKPPFHKETVLLTEPNSEGVYEVTGEGLIDAREED